MVNDHTLWAVVDATLMIMASLFRICCLYSPKPTLFLESSISSIFSTYCVFIKMMQIKGLGMRLVCGSILRSCTGMR